MEGYKLESRMINSEDQTTIVTALKGLFTAYDGSRYADVFEKLSSIFQKQEQRRVFLDFGVSGENADIQEKLKKLDIVSNEIAGNIAR